MKYLIIDKYKIPFRDCLTFKDRLKGFMFKLEPIQEGLRFPKCKSVHTYFMCQRIDIVMADKDNVIKKMFPNFASERFILPKKEVYYTYELPLGCCELLNIGDTLQVIEEDDEEENEDKEKESN